MRDFTKVWQLKVKINYQKCCLECTYHLHLSPKRNKIINIIFFDGKETECNEPRIFDLRE